MFKQIGTLIKILRLLLSGKAEVKKIMIETGWKSTRFWLTILTIGLNILGAVIGLLPANTVMWIVFVLTVLYLVMRTVAKLTPSLKDDALVEALEGPLSKLGVDTKAEQVPAAPKVEKAQPQAPPEK